MRTSDDDILWPHTKTNHKCKIWRAIINQSLVSFGSLPYNTTTNDTLFSVVNLPENIFDLCGGVGGGVSGAAFRKRYELVSCLLKKYVPFGDRYWNR